MSDRDEKLRAFVHGRVIAPNDAASQQAWLADQIEAFVGEGGRRSIDDLADFVERVFLAGVAAGISSAVDQMAAGSAKA
jgi:hypothetical protein